VLRFEEAFDEWWVLLQTSAGKNGGVLRYSGTNGILSIMLLLCWWGRAVLVGAKAQTRQWQTWNKYVAEVRRAFDGISESAHKRTLTIDDSQWPAAKRYVVMLSLVTRMILTNLSVL
jgi:hypothetical protein